MPTVLAESGSHRVKYALAIGVVASILGETMKIIGVFAPLALLLLASCAAPAAVSDINDSMVKVRGNRFTPVAEIDSTAQNACGQYKKTAVKMSQFCTDSQCAFQDTLYVCK